MTALEREKRDERNWRVKGQTVLHVVDIGRIPHNRSYFCIRETRNGFYVQSFNTVVLYVSKRNGKITRTWNGYSRASLVHINYALWWIKNSTQTWPEHLHLTGDQYYCLPYKWTNLIAA